MPNQRILQVVISKGLKTVTFKNPVANAIMNTEISVQISSSMIEVIWKGVDTKEFVMVVAKIRMPVDNSMNRQIKCQIIKKSLSRETRKVTEVETQPGLNKSTSIRRKVNMWSSTKNHTKDLITVSTVKRRSVGPRRKMISIIITEETIHYRNQNVLITKASNQKLDMVIKVVKVVKIGVNKTIKKMTIIERIIHNMIRKVVAAHTTEHQTIEEKVTKAKSKVVEKRNKIIVGVKLSKMCISTEKVQQQMVNVRSSHAENRTRKTEEMCSNIKNIIEICRKMTKRARIKGLIMFLIKPNAKI